VIAGPILGLVSGTAASGEIGISGHGTGFRVSDVRHPIANERRGLKLPDLIRPERKAVARHVC